MTEIVLKINGHDRRVTVSDDELLLDTLRDKLQVTSVREGCGVGACGACTALIDGHSVSTCLARSVRYDGAAIVTADGLPEDDRVVQAYVDCDAMQCGYCIPGFVLMTHELLDEQHHPDDEQIQAHLEGNLCRCGTYPEICAAVRELAK